MKSSAALLTAFTFTVLIQPLSFAEEPTGEIWVAIDATLKGIGTPPVEFYGALDRKVFEETLSRTMPSGFLKLTHAAWMEGGKVRRLAETTEDGVSRGYGDVMYFRVETVTRIVELDKGFVKKQMLPVK